MQEYYDRSMFSKILKEKKISVTRQRISILDALEKIGKPATIEIIKKTISGKIDRVTLYRSLSLLVDVGIVYQTDFREGVAYFELQQKHHHHIICTSCKSREPISFCMEQYFPELEKKTGHIITNHIFEIFGLCKTCLK